MRAPKLSPQIEEDHLRVYAVLPMMEESALYVSVVGQIVFDNFTYAWTELTTPAWGDRAIYYAHVPKSDLTGGHDDVESLKKNVMGWELLVPDDLTVLFVERSLDEKDFVVVSSARDVNSWFSQMAVRLTENRAGARTEDFDPLEYAYSVLPHEMASRLRGRLAGEIDGYKKQLALQEDELRSLRLKVETGRQAKLQELVNREMLTPAPACTSVLIGAEQESKLREEFDRMRRAQGLPAVPPRFDRAGRLKGG